MNEFFELNPVLETGIHVTPEKSTEATMVATPSRRKCGFAKFQFEETPKYNSFQAERNKDYLVLQSSPALSDQQSSNLFASTTWDGILKPPTKGEARTMSSHKSSYMLEFPPQTKYQSSFEPSEYSPPQRPESKRQVTKLQNDSEQYTLHDIHGRETSKKSGQMGLKSLSKQILVILKDLGYSTFRDVADTLISRLMQEKKIGDQNKEQLNIKRRTYDALNVLISCGLVKKTGKVVKLIVSRKQSLSLKAKLEELRWLRTEIGTKKQRLSEKQQRLSELCTRLQGREGSQSKRQHLSKWAAEVRSQVEAGLHY